MTVYLTYHIDPDIYYDIEGLESPFAVNIPLGITNNETFILYFRASLVSPPAAYGNTSKDLGSVAAGGSAFFIFNPTRTTPTLVGGEFDEALTLRIAAYKDAGYTDLYGLADLSMTAHYFNSLDAAWTMVYRDTFDDGTVQGWSYESGAKVDGTIGAIGNVVASATHFMSAPYGLANVTMSPWTNFKDYIIGAFTKARIVIHYWLPSAYKTAFKVAGKVILPAAIADVMPKGAWVRLSFWLPVSLTSRVYWQCSNGANGCWLDEIRVIAK